MKIYIAGPYTADTIEQREKNVERAIALGVAILKKGHVPFIPHLTHYVNLYAWSKEIEITWQEYMEWDFHWLNECDALYFIGHSRGATMELERATQMGIPVYRDLEEIPDGI